MHKDQLFSTTFTPYTDFLITASVDGQVSFWKKGAGGEHVEFVKEFKAHTEELTGTSVSWDGRSFASCGKDCTVKIWDVITFDLVAVLNMKKTPTCVCWVHSKSTGGVPALAVGNDKDGEIAIWDGRGEKENPNFVIKALHRQPVVSIAYNDRYDCAVSADQGGMIEYWGPRESLAKPSGVFTVKSETNLFDFKKTKSVPTSITISPTGQHFATFSFPDRKIRVFSFANGRLHRTYDESIATSEEMQQAGTAVVKLEDANFARRLAVELDLEDPLLRKRINVVFDETGHFLFYGSLHGIKVVNMVTNRVVKVYGKDETFRPVHLALYQGQPEKKGVMTVEMAASNNPLLQEAETRDAMLVSTGFNKVRFYMFTNESEPEKAGRDVQNEKPRELAKSADSKAEAKAMVGRMATIHTTYGDIQIRLFPDAAPKSVENFVAHSRNGYYNNVIFHRVIRKFMVQTGDPMGDGTGGESIWGKEFEDEFSSLKHDKPYTVSMANAGPNTNASQFFITTEKTPWLDGKHTIFGRALHGMDVIHKIENTKTRKEKPLDDIRIVNITVS